jgi:hypothetical protein
LLDINVYTKTTTRYYTQAKRELALEASKVVPASEIMVNSAYNLHAQGLILKGVVLQVWLGFGKVGSGLLQKTLLVRLLR